MQYENEQNYIKWFLIIVALDAFRAIPYAKLRQENKAARFALIKSIDIFSNIGFNLFFFFILLMALPDWYIYRHYIKQWKNRWLRW